MFNIFSGKLSVIYDVLQILRMLLVNAVVLLILKTVSANAIVLLVLKSVSVND